jgi:shikimate kinase
MKILLTGVSCVGKSTIGSLLAKKLNSHFFDLDDEIEEYHGESIERLKSKRFTEYSFRQDIGAQVLKQLISNNQDKDYVIALPPSGLMDSYYRIIKTIDCTVVILRDKAKNILERITFYDVDSKPMDIKISKKDMSYYLREIREDMKYFGRTYGRADLSVNISGLDIRESVREVQSKCESDNIRH